MTRRYRNRRFEPTEADLEAMLQRALDYDAEARRTAIAAAKAYAANGGRPAPATDLSQQGPAWTHEDFRPAACPDCGYVHHCSPKEGSAP